MKKIRFSLTIVGSFVILLILNVLGSIDLFRGDDLILTSLVNHLYLVIPLAMVTAWGIESMRHIINPKVRMNFMAIAISILIWIMIREVKWRYSELEVFQRYCWYAFYVPMCMIPLFGFNAAREVGMSDAVKNSKGWIALYTAGTALAALVMTNDLHGFVFHINGPKTTKDYTYQLGYFLIVAWIVILNIWMVACLQRGSKRKLAGWKGFAPLIVTAVGVGYGILYGIRREALIDLTTMFCWLTVAMWEICVFSGLIPTNTNHKDFFMASDLRAQIVDVKGQTLIAAQNAAFIGPGLFQELKVSGVRNYIKNTQLHMFPISCGAVIWQEDISRMTAMLEELAQNHQELQEGNTLAQEEMKASVRRERINEQNRLYTMLSSEMEGSLHHIRNLTHQLQVAQSPEEAHRLLSQINILGVYLKRRANFLMLSETSPQISVQELELCLMEIERNLIVCGVQFEYDILTERDLTKQEIFSAYDQLEPIIERTMFLTKNMKVSFAGEEIVTMTVSVPGQEDVVCPLKRGGDSA